MSVVLCNFNPISTKSFYGWLHAGYRDVGILICPGFGSDAADSYGTLHLLARELAQSGYPTFRLSYRGTGDASDLDGEEPCAAFLDSIRHAVTWLQDAGVRQVVLCGFRFGALLAGAVAAETGACALMLLDPVVSGSAYLRELQVAESLKPGGGFPQGAVEVDGLDLACGAEAPVRALALGGPLGACRHALLLTSGASAGAAKLAERWRASGVAVEQAPFRLPRQHDEDGYVSAGFDPGAILDWLDAVAQGTLRAPLRHVAPLAAAVATAAFAERPVRFGPAGGRFGVLCSPSREAAPGWVVLVCNAGAVPHQGYARLNVALARKLAAAGFASFRFDFAGLGDSGPVPAPGNHIYGTDRVPDFAAAMDALRALGGRRFVAAGLCSGAYHAWRAAVADERLEGLVMLNPTTFAWPKGKTLKSLLAENDRTMQSYVQASFYPAARTLLHVQGWQRLLNGRLDVARAAGKAARIVGARAWQGCVAAARRAAGTLGWPTPDQEAFKAMQRLSARGVRTLLVMGSADSGLKTLRRQFGRDGCRLAALPGCAVTLMPGVDHPFSRRAMQEQVFEAVLGFLRGNPDIGQPAGCQPAGAGRRQVAAVQGDG